MIALFAAVLASLPLQLPVVAIDAGHGGSQEGAVGVCGLQEKVVTLALAERLAEILTASKLATPLLVRAGDTTEGLSQRADKANAANAAVLLSIHANASPNSGAHGIETFFLSNRSASGRLARLAARENEGILPGPHMEGDPTLQLILNGLTLDAAHMESQGLALKVQQVLSEHLHAQGRGVLQAPFMVLLGSRMAAVLVEVGFLSNPHECALLKTPTHREVIARALATAVLAHLMEYGPEDSTNLARAPASP